MTESPPSPHIIDFDIRIFKTGKNAYRVTAQAPDSGLADSKLDVQALKSEDFEQKLRQIREEPFTTNEALFREVGSTLFHALFQGQVHDLFQAFYVQQVQVKEETYLRLRLNIDEAAIELATLPWELLHREDMFLATQINTIVTRQLLNLKYGAIKPLKGKDKPRVLLVIPEGSGLNTTREEKAITRALRKARIPYRILKGKVPLQLVDDTLAEGDYAVLHFIGHGVFDADESGALRGRLRFNAWDDAPAGEEEDWVTETDLQTMLGNYKNMKLVVLNACDTAELSERPDASGFWGVIPALLRAGIPAVIAMQYAIRDDVAVQFAETFYKRLTTGNWAGHVDIAVTLARNACFLAFPDDRGFATPALYLRSRDGVIFEAEHPTQQPRATASAPAAARPDCRKVPRPPDRLLYRYRNKDTDTLVASAPVLRGRLHRLTWQIDALKSRPHPTDNEQWQLQSYRKTAGALEREIDELQDVLYWRVYESCQIIDRLKKQLAAREQERDALEKADAYVSYELKNEIFTLNERILHLTDLIKTIQATLA
ncbi:MAG: hypothetical protein DSY55_02585 [Clostridia bacterium]|nr:MAG: hypothetical protein DSY55_02585 [Clostridia bacterium]